jgi:hypothetical protein
VCGNNQGFITASYNTGAVSGNGATGGVAGLNSAIHYEADPNATDEYNVDVYPATISACYNTGAVSSTDGPKGGIAGQNKSQARSLEETSQNNNTWQTGNKPVDDVYFEGTVENSYWSGTGPATGIGLVAAIGGGSSSDSGCTKFSDGQPSESMSNWGIGDDPDNGMFWKSVGTAPPTLYWE